jgi:hypothetical protein
MVIASAAHLALAARYVRKFGNVTDMGDSSPQVAVPRMNEWLGPPRSSIVAAIGWKQMRESGAIALAGLLGIVGIVLFVYAIESSRKVFTHTYAEVAVTLGIGIALVAGIGVSLHDAEPKLNAFWRSRPINADLWFVIKFLTGLSVVMATIYVPLQLIGGWVDPDVRVTMPALHIAMFAAAVAMTCIVRHVIYAAILSMGLLAASIATAWLAWGVGRKFGWTELDTSIYSPFEKPEVVLAGAIVCFVASTIAAWLATRNDWGWKSRY